MKTFVCLFIAFISSALTSLAQVTLDSATVKCQYLFTYQEDSTNAESKKSEAAILLIGKNISRFSTLNTLKADSVRAMIAKEREKHGKDYAMGLISSIPKTDFDFIIYKNYSTNQLTVVDKIFKNEYIFQEKNPELNWTIKSDKKTIAGYTCQKAIGSFSGRTYEAWFTTDIPIGEGPYKFSGLPGLIIAIEDTQHYFSFKLTSLVKPKIKQPITLAKDKKITTTRKDFDKGVQYYNDNFFEVTEAQGVTFDQNNAEFNRMIQEERKSRNNFIEKN